MHAITCAHKPRFTQSYSCKYTPKHTHYPTHKHTSSVSRTFGGAVCELPSFQGKAWPFTSILVFACTNCRVVQSIPGRWCLKAHFVSQCVQVILPELLTRVVRKGSVAEVGQAGILSDSNKFPQDLGVYDGCVCVCMCEICVACV